MSSLKEDLPLCACLLLCIPGFVLAQTSTQPTTATQNTAPASVRQANASGQIGKTRRSSQPSGSNSQDNPGTATGPFNSASPDTVTGAPRYRAGFRGPKGTTAPAATAKTTVIGVPNSTIAAADAAPEAGDAATGNAPIAPPQLPGVQLFHNSLGIRSGTPLKVRLTQAVDSGHAHNGDMIHGVLVDSVAGIPAGAPVQLTVVATAAAGQMSSHGELSLQIVSINDKPILSNVITAEGKEGDRLTADAAPERGTEAIFTPDQPITVPAS